MHFRKFSGYAVYPLLATLLSFLPIPALRAQNTSPPQQQQPGATVPPTDQSQNPSQQRAEVLREAQLRVNARRRQRIRQIIHDTYNHKYDIYFGGVYSRFRPGTSLQHVSEGGWDVGFVDYLHYLQGNLGVAADFRGYYGTAFIGPNPYSIFAPSISQYSFLGGPQYRFFEGQHWGWTAQILGGMGHGNFGTGTNGLPPTLIDLYPDSTVFNATAGASVDYNVSLGLGLRLTPNILFTNFGGQLQENLGWTLATVYRFGKK